MWPAHARSGHLEPSGIKKQHAKALKNQPGPTLRALQSPPHFPDSSWRLQLRCLDISENRGTQLNFNSSGYVHPSHDAVLAAVEKLGGRKIGTVQKRLCRSRNQRGRYQFETVEDEWSATLADFEPDFSPSQYFQTLSLNCISLLLRLLRLMRAMRV